MNFNLGDIFKNFNVFNNKISNVNDVELNNEEENSGGVLREELYNMHMYGIPQRDDEVQFKPDDGVKKYAIHKLPDETNESDEPYLAEKYAIHKLPDEPETEDSNPGENVAMYAIYRQDPEIVDPKPNVEKYAIVKPDPMPVNPTPVNPNPVNPGSGTGYVRPGNSTIISNPFRFSFSAMFGRIFSNFSNFMI